MSNISGQTFVTVLPGSPTQIISVGLQGPPGPPGPSGSGTVIEVDTGTGLTGGPITTTGIVAIANKTANTLAGFDDSGVFNDVTIGTGLTLEDGQLTATGAGTGTVTEINTGTGLTGGPITTSGTVSIENQTANTLAGFDNSGTFSDITVGSGLSLSSGTLSATGGGSGVSSVSNVDGTLAVSPTTGAVIASLAPLSNTKILIGNVSNIATPVNIGGDASIINTGTLTVTKTNGVSFAASATTDTTNASNITSGTLPSGRLPNPSLSALGGVESYTAPSHQWVNEISTSGSVSSSQPAFTDISGTLNNTQLPTSGVSAGSYTNTNLTVNAEGIVTAASNGTSGGVSSISNSDGTLTISPTTGPAVASLAPLSSGDILVGNVSNIATAVAVSGDASLVSTGAITVTKTNGVSFAASATTDTTNAANITSGTLPSARLPNPTATTLGGVESITPVSHNFLTSISTSGVPTQAQPSASDISGLAASATIDTTNASNITSGTLPAGRLPNPTAVSLGGIESLASSPHQWINQISTSGVPSTSQPAFTDISGTASLTSQVAGILPPTNGGTGANNTSANGHLMIGSGSSSYVDGQLTSTGNTINITQGAGTLNIDTVIGAIQPGFNTSVATSGGNTLVDALNSTTVITATSTTLNSSSPAFIQVNSTANPITIILPVTTTCSGKRIDIQPVAGTNSITIQTQGSDTFSSGGMSVTFSTGVLNQTIQLISNGNGIWRNLKYILTPVTQGGTGLSSVPSAGQLLIGNNSGFTETTLTASTNQGVTNAPGSITLFNIDPVTCSMAGGV